MDSFAARCALSLALLFAYTELDFSADHYSTILSAVKDDLLAPSDVTMIDD